MAMGAVVIVLVRRPVLSSDASYSKFDTTESMFKQQPDLPEMTQNKAPPITMSGNSRDGYEWIEWPPNTDQHWYRTEGSAGDWNQYQS